MITHKTITIMILAVVLSMSATAQATTYYVTADGNDDANGLSWATAFATINKGVDTAVDGNEIWVAEGTYTLTSQINVDNAIGVYGGFEGDETTRSQRDWSDNPTIVSGNDSVTCFNVTDDATIDALAASESDAISQSCSQDM